MTKILALCLFFFVGAAQAQQFPYTTDARTCAASPTVNTVAGATLVLKTSAGSLCSYTVVNLTATAGFVAVLNATSAPVDGAITPVDCRLLATNGQTTVNWPTPLFLNTGITIVVTSAATCFTKTTGVITAFISGNLL